MFKLHGVILTDLLKLIFSLLILISIHAPSYAINVGNLTFSMSSQDDYMSKRVINNNRSARLYRVTIFSIDRPGENETRTRPADGEILFSPRQITLQAGESEYFKFYYHGEKDNQERYYRISFYEIPTRNYGRHNKNGSEVSIDPVVVLDTILVVRPRNVDFNWRYDKTMGRVENNGNTWFKLLIKPGCDSTEEKGSAWYLRPGEVVSQSTLKQPGVNYIIYNDKFIKISDSCEK
ncbi:fimbria/pilus periplasmic chaperone [Klebsiella variicola]|uniref:fimbria/pilus periplasmic chaperone n=1 Tax=Klebsiella variicola TaxID=244366 RepID=UPI00292A88E4|nr:fimbria/pilus periplasmic chaperone [Klebsiella variicola]MDV0910902.1 fimbria/pilus periplasmic chaperone [Klebsiella variicola subsp. variicola]HBR0931145.1 fimbria/pilus periplasmic chaperone [Klebsiella variicola]HBR1095560.1 fimbria/pilus periplasmic chaperone [Klebsiella variicola]HBU5898180.1 fimbria/pilus periplasmic chaperone [Klebsiella variicola]